MPRLQIREDEQQRADARTCLTPMAGDGLVQIAERDRRLSTFDRPFVRQADVVLLYHLRTKEPDRPIVSNIR